ncbi:flagellar biosynthesis protein FliQ [Desulfococcus sp.]|uniref:flagellar biosynthesis protein FliQ n=1 Tax=Desulfococcus sp. TaxID=2025834 RepID=UPI003593B202
MTPEFVTGFFFDALKTAILLSAPMLAASLITGVAISMFQAATQINEMTLVFIPKMIAIVVTLLLFFPWMLQLLVGFTRNLLIHIPNYVR